MKLVKLTLVVAMFLSAGNVKAEDGIVGPRTNLDEYRAGEFKCPRELADMKRSSVNAAQADATVKSAEGAN